MVAVVMMIRNNNNNSFDGKNCESIDAAEDDNDDGDVDDARHMLGQPAQMQPSLPFASRQQRTVMVDCQSTTLTICNILRLPQRIRS